MRSLSLAVLSSSSISPIPDPRSGRSITRNGRRNLFLVRSDVLKKMERKPERLLVNKVRCVGCKDGSRYVEGQGDPLVENKKGLRFLGFLVSEFLSFLSFLIPWFLSFVVSWLLGFKASQLRSCLGMIPYYQMLISCSLEDIDPVSKLFENLFNGSSGFVGPSLPTFSKLSISNIFKLESIF